MFDKAIPRPGSIAALRARPPPLTEPYGERRLLADQGRAQAIPTVLID